MVTMHRAIPVEHRGHRMVGPAREPPAVALRAALGAVGAGAVHTGPRAVPERAIMLRTSRSIPDVTACETTREGAATGSSSDLGSHAGAGSGGRAGACTLVERAVGGATWRAS